jgi:hypothetical protein
MSTATTYRPRFGFDIRINPDRPRTNTATKKCAAPGCRETAEVRAPTSQKNPDARVWLCREHLRKQNERWNYFAGMSEAEIDRFRVDALTGHRPTWPLGKRAAKSPDPGASSAWSHHVADAFGFFEADTESQRPPPRATRLTKGQLDALAALNLEEGASLHDIKARYKELVKRFHPDANGGDRGTEERLKQVIKAYGHLRATKLV